MQIMTSSPIARPQSSSDVLFGRRLKKSEVKELKEIVRQIPELGDEVADNLNPGFCSVQEPYDLLEGRPTDPASYLDFARLTFNLVVQGSIMNKLRSWMNKDTRPKYLLDWFRCKSPEQASDFLKDISETNGEQTFLAPNTTDVIMWMPLDDEEPGEETTKA